MMSKRMTGLEVDAAFMLAARVARAPRCLNTRHGQISGVRLALAEADGGAGHCARNLSHAKVRSLQAEIVCPRVLSHGPSAEHLRGELQVGAVATGILQGDLREA